MRIAFLALLVATVGATMLSSWLGGRAGESAEERLGWAFLSVVLAIVLGMADAAIGLVLLARWALS